METRRHSRALLSLVALVAATACTKGPMDDDAFRRAIDISDGGEIGGGEIGGGEIGGGEIGGGETGGGETSGGATDDGTESTGAEPDGTPSTLIVDVAASNETLTTHGIASWHLEVPSTGAGARIEGRDPAAAVVHTVELRIDELQIDALLDDIRIGSEAEAAVFDALWLSVVRDTETASAAAGELASGDLTRCLAAIRALNEAVATLGILTTTPGAVALGIVFHLCRDCFISNTNCDVNPLPIGNGTCRNARDNTLGQIPAAARAVRQIRRYCRCGTTGFAEVGGDGGGFAATCSDDPCDEMCVGASGDVAVDRGGYGEVCHCDEPNPCEGNPDPCCGSTDPCCGSNDPCCGSNDPCCGSGDPCCGSWDECCGSNDPCCGSNDECCGNPDPCCGNWDECCGNPDPCCGSGDPCCGVICFGDDYCDGGECIHTDVTILCESNDDCGGGPCVNGHCSPEH